MPGLMRRLGLSEYGGDEMLLATLACAALAWALGAGATPLAALAALVPWGVVVWFFRDPERRAPDAPGALVSPADGAVTDIVELDEPRYVCGRALRVGIFLSPLDVHVNRSPCDGLVLEVNYCVGEFLPAYDPRAPQRNESNEIILATPEGLRVLVKQIGGVLARRIVCTVQPGGILTRGERYGMIKFGSRTELYVPANAGLRAAVSVGQKVVGGETVLLAPVDTLGSASDQGVVRE